MNGSFCSTQHIFWHAIFSCTLLSRMFSGDRQGEDAGYTISCIFGMAFLTLLVISHRFLLLLTEKTIIDKPKR
jgi:hypothetical protein